MSTYITKAYDSKNRVLCSIRTTEAVVLVAMGYGKWRGKKRNHVTLYLTRHQIVSFVGQMRTQPPLDAIGIDSRTHKNLGGLRGYKHVRCAPYSRAGSRVTEEPDDEEIFLAYQGAVNQVRG